MTRAECIAVWKAARSGDEAKLQKMLVESRDALGPNLVNWKHHRKGTTPLMVAAECKNGEPAVRQLLAAGADANAEDDTKLMNTALHYAAMTNRDAKTVEALLQAGADAFALNRKGLSPLDLARQNRRAAVAAALMEHVTVHCGWLYLRGKFRWKKRWAVLVACNKQRTSRELCVFHNPDDLRPDAVLLVDEAAKASAFLSSDSFCWLKRNYAFVFDKPVMCQRVKGQKLTRSPICRKTMSHEDVQTRNLVFAADSYHSAEHWKRVLQSSNFYDHESGAPLYGATPYDAPRGELYYWPRELVENVRSSTLQQQEQQREVDSDPLLERLRRTLELRNSEPQQQQQQDDEPLEDMLRGLQGSSEGERRAPGRVRFASDPQKHVDVVQPAQQPPPSEDDAPTTATANGNNATESSEQQTPPTEADEEQTPRRQEQEEDDDLCGMCCSQRRNAVCAPCGHRAGCHACLRTVMHTSHACPYCRARVRSIMRVYD
ncbi:hypothetical protein PHYBOEH_010855 [Phytophthora boehmeriae]|uniref:RING-type domain-containing protein n=1 Tax=Phytophthora boehmeriae TaxID=109152 RepID=A0A8T1WZ61_9STRA|nr:hypothetical protein PHYBOEH_010855 [Phytophthora boehmeriae]